MSGRESKKIHGGSSILEKLDFDRLRLDFSAYYVHCARLRCLQDFRMWCTDEELIYWKARKDCRAQRELDNLDHLAMAFKLT